MSEAEYGKKWMNSNYALDVEPIELKDELDIANERLREIKNFYQDKGMVDGTIYEDGVRAVWEGKSGICCRTFVVTCEMHVQYQSRAVKEAPGHIALEVRGASWAGPWKGKSACKWSLMPWMVPG